MDRERKEERQGKKLSPASHGNTSVMSFTNFFVNPSYSIKVLIF